MPDTSKDSLKSILGSNLQTGALRAVLILAAFTFVGATLAWLIH